MNKKIKRVIKNVQYTVSSNLTSTLISFVTLLIAPKFLGISDYSYYQLYVFYSGYVGFFHLGWCDGIYLRFGGVKYQQLNKDSMSTQFWLLTLFEFILMVFLFVIVNAGFDGNKKIVLLLTISSIIAIIPKVMLTYVLQATNRIRCYANVVIIERILFVIFIFIIYIMNKHNFFAIIISDIIAKIISLILAIFYCRDIVFYKVLIYSGLFKEVYKNISIGSKLMLANIASSLILGIVRFSIEQNWSIETFGKVSLSITFSNMLMIFVNAVSIVLFPMLRRIEQDKIVILYEMMRQCLMMLLLAMLLCYFPVSKFLTLWLPQYTESLRYMALLFPICIFESKMSMLVNTYLKSLRKEKHLLFVNIFAVILSLIISWISVIVLQNLEFTVFMIVVLFALRSTFSEFILSKFIDIKIWKDIILEFVLSFIFIICSWYITGLIGFMLYLMFYFLYLFLKKDTIKRILINFKKEILN